jgi:hypothetical protein
MINYCGKIRKTVKWRSVLQYNFTKAVINSVSVTMKECFYNIVSISLFTFDVTVYRNYFIMLS